jgi:hypothetical protein
MEGGEGAVVGARAAQKRKARTRGALTHVGVRAGVSVTMYVSLLLVLLVLAGFGACST